MVPRVGMQALVQPLGLEGAYLVLLDIPCHCSQVPTNVAQQYVLIFDPDFLGSCIIEA